MTTLLVSLCDCCKHYREGDTCAAFPEGIPWDMLYMYHDHREPYPGDQGIRFEVRDDDQARTRLQHVYKRHKYDGAKAVALGRRVKPLMSVFERLFPERERLKLLSAIRRTPDFDALAPKYQEMILEAERRTAGKETEA
jgi:hypothetical protein